MQWRELPLTDRLSMSESLRQQGGELFRDDRWEAAAEKYAQAARDNREGPQEDNRDLFGFVCYSNKNQILCNICGF